MRVAVFSLGPVFPHHVHGGSQKTLGAITRHLGGLGAEVSIFCTRRDDNHEAFTLGPSVSVHPILRYKQTYPEPHYTAPYNLANVIQVLGRAAETHDRFYVHDGELLYPFIYEDVPAVISVQDFVYPDTLAGALSFRRDHLVVSSRYVQQCVEQVFRGFRPLPAGSVTVAPNGFDINDMHPTDPAPLRAELGIADDAIAVLYPHRPDPRKGIWETVQTVLGTLDQLPAEAARRVRLLVPEWVDSNVAGDTGHVYQGIYGDVRRYATEAGWPDLVTVHPWLPVARMPEYFSLGVATMCIGSFVEAFGNVSIESQLCGTPAIVSRVAAQRSVLPEHLVNKVDFGDIKTASEVLLACMAGDVSVPQGFGEFVRAHYSHEGMVNTYASAIMSADMTRPLTAVHLPCDPPRAVEIPAWCALLDSGFYNDYSYGYADDPRLHEVAARTANGPTNCTDLADLGDAAAIEQWITDGYLVRVR